jgi:hypothetical protein
VIQNQQTEKEYLKMLQQVSQGIKEIKNTEPTQSKRVFESEE